MGLSLNTLRKKDQSLYGKNTILAPGLAVVDFCRLDDDLRNHHEHGICLTDYCLNLHGFLGSFLVLHAASPLALFRFRYGRKLGQETEGTSFSEAASYSNTYFILDPS